MDVVNSKVLFSKGEMFRCGETNFKAFSLGVGKVLNDKNLADNLAIGVLRKFNIVFPDKMEEVGDLY